MFFWQSKSKTLLLSEFKNYPNIDIFFVNHTVNMMSCQLVCSQFNILFNGRFNSRFTINLTMGLIVNLTDYFTVDLTLTLNFSTHERIFTHFIINNK